MKKKFFARIGTRIRTFWFRPVSATGFGLMRVAFGVTTLLNFLMQASNVQRFYGPEGMLQREMVPTLLRQEWRFSLLDYVGAQGTQFLYLLLVASLVLVILGVGTRVALLITVVLMYSFHEYGVVLLDSGDSLLNLIGFILLLSPCDRTFTLRNAERRSRAIAAGKDPMRKTPTMPIWPYRLLLWQIIVMYISAAYGKMSGPTWYSGSAPAIAFHHGHFARLPMEYADMLAYMSPVISYFTVFTQLGWGLLLLLPIFGWIGLRIPTDGIKRLLILAGIIVHGGILLLMDVGTFSLAVFTAYCGLLLEEDFVVIKHWSSSLRRVGQYFPHPTIRKQ